MDLINSNLLKTLSIDRLFRFPTCLLPQTSSPTSSSAHISCNHLMLVDFEQSTNDPTISKSWSLTRNFKLPENIPNIRLIHSPNLHFIPILSHNCSPCWLISVELVFKTSSLPTSCEVILIPHLKSTRFSNSWTLYKIRFNLVNDQDHSLVLVAFGHRNLFQDLSIETPEIDLYIHLVCNSCPYILKLLDPFRIDFKSLLSTPSSIVDSLWTRRPDLLPRLLTLTRQWTLRTTSRTISANLESLLGWNRASDYRDNGNQESDQKRWFFTSGILAGTLLEFVPDLMLLKARSCSPLNLKLIESALRQLPDTVIQQHTPNRDNSRKNNKSIRTNQSHLEQLRDCLTNEIECLMEQTALVIVSTMHEHVPKLPMFVEDLGNNNNLEIAHRLTEWRSLVENAIAKPIENVGPSGEYVIRRQSTDDCIKLCSLLDFSASQSIPNV